MGILCYIAIKQNTLMLPNYIKMRVKTDLNYKNLYER